MPSVVVLSRDGGRTSIKAETLSHWMDWNGEPYETFQRLVRKAEAGLDSRMVTILAGQAEVRPKLALAGPRSRWWRHRLTI